MSFFCEIRNGSLIRELQREINTDVLLFGVDGFTYFGNLQFIEDCRIAILTPGGDLRRVEFLRVDLWSVVGKGTGIAGDPIDPQGAGTGTGTGSGKNTGSGRSHGSSKNSDSGKSGSGKNSSKGGKGPRPCISREVPADDGERQESHILIKVLKRMIGDNVAIATLGGFLFAGILGYVRDELAILTVDDIFVPGTSSSISDSDVRSVVVNLEALTSVAGTNTSIS